jgi:hypothetical protein
MTPGAPRDGVAALPDEPWTTRYETMRGQVMASSHTIAHVYGYAILVRRGLVAWMKAWPRSAPAPSRDAVPNRAPAGGVTVPSYLLRSATSLLVNMILTPDARTDVPHEQRPVEGLGRASSP